MVASQIVTQCVTYVCIVCLMKSVARVDVVVVVVADGNLLMG